MKSFSSFLYAVLVLCPLVMASAAKGAVDCRQFPFATECQGTSAYCDKFPLSSECEGSSQYCDKFPLSSACEGSSQYCDKFPLSSACEGSSQYCDKFPLSDSCRPSGDICENNPNHPSCKHRPHHSNPGGWITGQGGDSQSDDNSAGTTSGSIAPDSSKVCSGDDIYATLCRADVAQANANAAIHNACVVLGGKNCP